MTNTPKHATTKFKADFGQLRGFTRSRFTRNHHHLMLFIFMQTLSYDTPKWIGANGIIGVSPGLGLRPKQTDALIDSSMILFNKDARNDTEYVAGWFGWANRTSNFLSNYKNNGKVCSPTNPPKTTLGEACQFKTTNLGPCAKGNHGYDTGSPCIFLKLNNIYGLRHDYYNDTANLPEKMPEHLVTHIKAQRYKNQVWVDCRGENAADREHLKRMKYYPATRGFPAYYFPYVKQDTYESPVVAVQFPNLPVGQLVHVECRAWAGNIGYEKRDRIGISHFEIMVHDKKTAAEYEKAIS